MVGRSRGRRLRWVGAAPTARGAGRPTAAVIRSRARGVEGQGCHNLYPECPFSNQDVTQIAKRINFK